MAVRDPSTSPVIPAPAAPILTAVESIAALKALAGTDITGTVEVLSRIASAIPDGLGGVYTWNSTDTRSDDSATLFTIIQPDSGGIGRWNQVTTGSSIQSGAGAVARSVQDKLREVITSADFNDTHGTQNTGLGVSVLSSVITGDKNTAIGYQALKANTGTINVDGRANVAIGPFALTANTIGSQNIAIGGNEVLFSNTTGGNNVAVGNASNHDNVSGNDNVSVGVDTLRFNTGTGNTAIGTSALQSQVAGASNTALGQGAGANNISGVQGIFIGFSAGRYETASNTFYVDNTNRGSSAADEAGALFYGSSIGTGAVALQRLQINAVVTRPVQPAFLALATATANATGDATLATIIFGTEVFDQHSDFASNTFTAPVTGKYHFDANIQGTGIAAGNTAYLINFNTTKRSITACRINPGPIIVAGELNLCAGITCDMDAGDTCSVRFEVDGGTKIVGYGAGSFFSGYLVA